MSEIIANLSNDVSSSAELLADYPTESIVDCIGKLQEARRSLLSARALMDQAVAEQEHLQQHAAEQLAAYAELPRGQ